MAMKKHENWIELARSGRYPGKVPLTKQLFEFNVARFKQIIKNGLPYVIGHPKIDGPAWGWADEIKVEPNEERGPDRGWSLFVRGEVEETFADTVNNRRYTRVSPGFNMFTGLLKHVGFLGAAEPAMTNLPQVSFSADDTEAVEVYEFDPQRVNNAAFAATEKRTRTMKYVFNPQSGKYDVVDDAGNVVNSVSAAEFAAAGDSEKKIRELEAANKKLAEENAAALFAATVAEERVLIEGLCKEGKLLPAQAAGLGEFMANLPAGKEDAFEFASADGKSKSSATPREFMRSLLKALPVQVALGKEVAKLAPKGAPTAAQFAAGGENLDEKIRQHALDKNISYSAAFDAIVTGKAGDK